MGSSAKSDRGNYRTPSRDSYKEMKDEIKRMSEKMEIERVEIRRMREEQERKKRERQEKKQIGE